MFDSFQKELLKYFPKTRDGEHDPTEICLTQTGVAAEAIAKKG